MEVKQSSQPGKGKFFIEDNGKPIAVMTYYEQDSQTLVVEHTVVNPDHEGKGLGKKLVDAVTAYARLNHLKIVPVCPYTNKVMHNSDSYKDVLA
jgi:predicted GNAT family acetyltransferase